MNKFLDSLAPAPPEALAQIARRRHKPLLKDLIGSRRRVPLLAAMLRKKTKQTKKKSPEIPRCAACLTKHYKEQPCGRLRRRFLKGQADAAKLF